MTNIPEIEELELALKQAQGAAARLKDRYIKEDRRVVHVEGFGWAVCGPGSHIRAAMPEEIAKAKPTGDADKEKVRGSQLYQDAIQQSPYPQVAK